METEFYSLIMYCIPALITGAIAYLFFKEYTNNENKRRQDGDSVENCPMVRIGVCALVIAHSPYPIRPHQKQPYGRTSTQ